MTLWLLYVSRPFASTEEKTVSFSSSKSCIFHNCIKKILKIATFADYDDVDMGEANLLDVMVEDKAKFQSSYSTGETAMELFMDRKNPWNKSIHPALPKIIQEKLVENRRRGEW